MRISKAPLNSMWAWINLALLLLAPLSQATNFDLCKARIQQKLASNDSAVRASAEAILWPLDKPVAHFRPDKSNGTRPLLITVDGCSQECGRSPELHSPADGIQVLVTWVLPIIALLVQLPFESAPDSKLTNLWALIVWLGAPAVTLTATMWNIFIIKRCQKHYLRGLQNLDVHRDVYYVISCLNQFEYPIKDYRFNSDNDEAPRRRRQDPGGGLIRPRPTDDLLAEERIASRDRALFYGICKPLEETNYTGRDSEITWLIQELAFQLRIVRRRGVLPLTLSIAWFFLAFTISAAQAFEDLGDNSTAHGLALGLLLSWLPTLVVITITDRNPVAATRTRSLIERWLYNCHHIRIRSAERWSESTGGFSIGEYMGQGRRPGYAAVGWAILNRLAVLGYVRKTTRNPYPVYTDTDDTKAKENIRQFHLWFNYTHKSVYWYVGWLVGLAVQATGVWMAFLVSYNTPTVGLGCRSLLYVLYFVFSMVPQLLELIPALRCNASKHYELKILGGLWLPKTVVRTPMYVYRLCAACAATLLPVIMFLHVTYLLNHCLCKGSTFGGEGGYVDFEGAQFYRDHYGVKDYWISAVVVGATATVAMISWAATQWVRSKKLWRQKEDWVVEMTFRDQEGGRGADGVDHTLDWLR